MDKALKKEWNCFLNGCWQKQRPHKPGKYPVVSILSSNWCGETRRLFVDPETKYLREVPGYGGWGGYWWSEPFPELPKLGGCS